MKQAFAYVDAHFDEFVAELGALCALPSTADRPDARAQTCTTLKNKLASLGFEPVRHGRDGEPAVLSGRRSVPGKPAALFYNHYDVVPEGPLSDWQTPPFEPAIRDGALYARGVSDNKGALMARLQAMEAILKTDGALPAGAAFLLDGDEETGSSTLSRMVTEEPALLRSLTDAAFCLWENGRTLPDGSAEIACGVRSTLTVDLHVRTSNGDEHARTGAELPNAAWRLIWALASLKDMQERILIDGFYDDVAPFTDADRAVLAAYPYDEEAELRRKEIGEFLLGLRGQALRRRIYMEPTITVTSMEAGEPWRGKRNIVPHTAAAHVSFILVPDQRAETVLAQLRAHLCKNGFSDVEVTASPSGFPVRTPVDHPYGTLLNRAAKAAYGIPATPAITQLGSGPAYLLRTVRPELPIFCACGVAAHDSGHHSAREHLWLENYRSGIKHTIATLYELSRFQTP